MISQPISEPAVAATTLPGANAESQGSVEAAVAPVAAVSATEAVRIKSESASASLAYEVITVPAVGEPGREELRQQCYDVRIAVFSVEQGFPLETEIDE